MSASEQLNNNAPGAVNFEQIPSELKALPRWVCWRNEQGRKVPYDANALNSRASSTDPQTWATFEQAQIAYNEREGDNDAFTGVGIVLDGDGLAGVDIDHCVKDGQPDPAALALLDSMGAAYVEVSPSTTGLRAFGYAGKLESGCKGTLNGLSVELYSTGRYLTLTGHTIKAGPIAPLRGFGAIAERIRADRKVNPTTGEIEAAPPDERHAELVRRILSGDVYHDSLRDLAASLVATGMQPGGVVNHLRGLMDASTAPKDDRWKARRAQIPGLVSSARAKFEPVDYAALLASENASNEPTFQPVNIADVLSNPEPPHPFVWGPYVPTEALTLLSAHGGTGKSGFGLQMAAHVALGREFLGQSVIRSNTLFFSGEDARGQLRLRMASICKNHGFDPEELAQSMHILDATDAAMLWQSEGPKRPGAPTGHYQALRRFIEDREIGLLIVDNASDSFAGDRFDKSDVTRFIRALVSLVRRQRGAVLLLSHVNRGTASKRQESSESYSDSVAWHNAARSRLFLEGEEDDTQRTLKHEKSNYGAKGRPLALEAMPGCGVRLLGADGVADEFKQAAARFADELAHRQLLVLVHEFAQRGESINPSPQANSANAWGMLRGEAGFPTGQTRGDVLAHFRTMERNGYLAKERYTKPNRHTGERWAITDKGRAFAKLPDAPTAPAMHYQNASALTQATRATASNSQFELKEERAQAVAPLSGPRS